METEVEVAEVLLVVASVVVVVVVVTVVAAVAPNSEFVLFVFELEPAYAPAVTGDVIVPLTLSFAAKCFPSFALPFAAAVVVPVPTAIFSRPCFGIPCEVSFLPPPSAAFAISTAFPSAMTEFDPSSLPPPLKEASSPVLLLLFSEACSFFILSFSKSLGEKSALFDLATANSLPPPLSARDDAAEEDWGVEGVERSTAARDFICWRRYSSPDWREAERERGGGGWE